MVQSVTTLDTRYTTRQQPNRAVRDEETMSSKNIALLTSETNTSYVIEALPSPDQELISRRYGRCKRVWH